MANPQNCVEYRQDSEIQTLGTKTEKKGLCNGHDIAFTGDEKNGSNEVDDIFEYQSAGEDRTLLQIMKSVQEFEKSVSCTNWQQNANKNCSQLQGQNGNSNLVAKTMSTELEKSVRIETGDDIKLHNVLGSRLLKTHLLSEMNGNTAKLDDGNRDNVCLRSPNREFKCNGTGYVGNGLRKPKNSSVKLNGHLKQDGEPKPKRSPVHVIGNGTHLVSKSVTHLQSKPIPNGHTVHVKIQKSKNGSNKWFHKKTVEGMKINTLEDTHRHNGGRVFQT